MTTHPEDAMKRERALEEAWRKRCNDPTLRNDRASFLTFKAGYEAALASAQQEPAPAADAERDLALLVVTICLQGFEQKMPYDFIVGEVEATLSAAHRARAKPSEKGGAR